MQTQVKFVKWVDPFKLAIKNRSDDEFEEARSTFARDHSPYSGAMMIGPAGAFPLHESSFPGELFNLWMVHTNVDLSGEIKDAIMGVPGVETFDIFTRYRSRIGIGKVFNEQEVKDGVKAAIIAASKSGIQKLVEAARD